MGLAEKAEIYFVESGSKQWCEARDLRYALFFQLHGLAPSIMDDELEAGASHLVAVVDGRVVGCGRLTEPSDGEFKISQMVVLPSHQGKGIGGMILQRLINKAQTAGANTVELNARLSASGFYANAGFAQCGLAFPSATTGIPHAHMRLKPKEP